MLMLSKIILISISNNISCDKLSSVYEGRFFALKHCRMGISTSLSEIRN